MWKSNSIPVFLLIFFVLPVVPASAAGKQFAWYLDGARVEQEIEVKNGVAEVVLPPEMQPGSFRARPLGRARLARVELLPVTPGRGEEREAARIAERREELLDRLKALSVKEEIFKATAKTQGGKAPRRTRTNPEPLAAIRQGTDFAIARLEEVYKAKRKAEQELKELEKRLSILQRQETVSGKLARIRLEGNKGAVRIAYVITGKGWQPLYDVRVSGNMADVTMSALFPRDVKGAAKVVASRLGDTGPANFFTVGAGNPPRISVWRLPVTTDTGSVGTVETVTVKLRNDSGGYLPPGDASLFIREEYVGTVWLSGGTPGGTVELSVGSGGIQVQGKGVKE